MWERVKECLKGRFWIFVRTPVALGGSIPFEGDPNAVPRNDPRWNEQWKWVVLNADMESSGAAWYYIYFTTGSIISMRYFRKIKTPYVAVQVGPSDVTFYAAGKSRGTWAGIRLALRCGQGTEEEIKNELPRHGILLQDVTWI